MAEEQNTTTKQVAKEEPVKLGQVQVNPQSITPAAPFTPNSEATIKAAEQAEVPAPAEEEQEPKKEETAEAPAAETVDDDLGGVLPPSGEVKKPDVKPAEAEKKDDEPNAEAEQIEPAEDDKDKDKRDEILEATLRAAINKPDPDEGGDPMYDLGLNQVILGKHSDILADIARIYKTEAALKAARKDPKSLISRISEALETGWGSSSHNDLEDILRRNDAYKALAPQSEMDKAIRDARPTSIRLGSVDLAGDDAMLAIKSRLGGLIRIQLLNSGFWIAIRAPSLAELQELYASVDIEGRELGRIIGGHMCLCVDMFLKQKLIDLLFTHKMIMRSNFAFKDKNEFIRNLAYHDYDTILHAFVTLMSRHGFRVRLICPHCDTQSVETNMDISGAKFVNMNLMTEPVRKWWATTHTPDGKPVVHTEEDLKKYRNEILNFHMVSTQVVNNGVNDVKVELDIIEPTYDRFFSVGQHLIDQLNSTINAIANGEESRANLVKASLNVHGFQLIAPWVREMRLVNEAGEVEVRTVDPAVIVDYLDQLLQEDTTSMFTDLHEFVSKSKFNYFGSFSIKCPKCGATPESNLDNFYPLEIQTIFFGLFFRHLRVEH